MEDKLIESEEDFSKKENKGRNNRSGLLKKIGRITAPPLAGFLPSDLQRKGAELLDIEPNNFTNFNIISSVSINLLGLYLIDKGVDGEGLSSLLRYGSFGYVGLNCVNNTIRAAYSLTTKKPIGSLPYEIAWRSMEKLGSFGKFVADRGYSKMNKALSRAGVGAMVEDYDSKE